MAVTGVLRGQDGTGIFIKTPQHVTLYKRALWGPDFISTKGYSKLVAPNLSSANLVIGHNRAATRNSIADANAHPFTEKHITLVHNGHISNADILMPKGRHIQVDTEAVPYVMAEHGEKEGLEQLRGAFALAWYNSDDDTFNIARNSDRELWCAYVAEHDAMFFASEWMMMHWLLSRNGVQIDGKYRFVPAFRHLKFQLNKPREYTSSPFAQPQDLRHPHHMWYGQGSGRQHQVPTIPPTTTKETTGSETTSTDNPPEETAKTVAPLAGDDLTKIQEYLKSNLSPSNRSGLPSTKKKLKLAYKRLHEVGLHLAQLILVVANEFIPYKNQKVLGVIKGYRQNDAKSIVEIPNVPYTEFMAVKSGRDGRRPYLYCSLINVRKDAGKTVLIAAINNLNDETKRKEAHALAKAQREKSLAALTFRGPYGATLTLDRFKDAVKEKPCGFCNGPVNPLFADKVMWFGEEPICHECTSNEDVCKQLALSDEKIATAVH